MLGKGQDSCAGGNNNPVILFNQPVCSFGNPGLLSYLDLLLFVNMAVVLKN